MLYWYPLLLHTKVLQVKCGKMRMKRRQTGNSTRHAPRIPDALFRLSPSRLTSTSHPVHIPHSMHSTFLPSVLCCVYLRQFTKKGGASTSCALCTATWRSRWALAGPSRGASALSRPCSTQRARSGWTSARRRRGRWKKQGATSRRVGLSFFVVKKRYTESVPLIVYKMHTSWTEEPIGLCCCTLTLI